MKNTHILVNICNVNFYILFLFSFLFSCDKNTDIQEIPSYINVSKVNLLTSSVQGSNTHKITDIWVYVNDQFRGTFEIPATIPLLHKDSNNIRLFLESKIMESRLLELDIIFINLLNIIFIWWKIVL